MSDYIIVGAGSAGCVLANRLSESASVTLLEAGPRDHGWDFRLHMPAALSELLKSDRYNWAYRTEPEPFMDGRSMYCPRGRVLGGSSSINGMIFVRGNARDFDRWSSHHGLPGWDYAHCLPYFRKSETVLHGDPRYRGTDGPLRITRGELENPLFGAWLTAAGEAGFPLTDDFNGEVQEGAGPFDRTIDGGARMSTARGYLDPVRGRENLSIVTGGVVTRILLKGGVAKGVEYFDRGRTVALTASREVILCAGAINSPQLLQLSGIGDPALLSGFRIPVVAESPDVGCHLQDHLEVYLQYACRQSVSIYPSTRWYAKPLVGLRWLLAREGAGATNHFEAGAFLRSGLDGGYPDLQYHFLPVAMDYDGKDQYRGHGFQLHVGPMKPESRGRVALRSTNPLDAPAVSFNYAASEHDRQVMRRGIRIGRDIVGQPAFDAFRGREIRPGSDAVSDMEIDRFVRRYGESAYHPSGTCRMGGDDRSVVDEAARVRGVDGLRVIDASILPEITNGNLNAVVVMLAEKLADTISSSGA